MISTVSGTGGKYQMVEHDDDGSSQWAGTEAVLKQANLSKLCNQAKYAVDTVHTIPDEMAMEKHMAGLRNHKLALEERLNQVLDASGGVGSSEEVQHLLSVQEEVDRALRAHSGPQVRSAQPEEREDPEGEFFTVYLSSGVMNSMSAANVSIDDYALEFGHLVSNADSAPPSRSLDADGARRIFARVAQGHAQVVGFSEVACSDRGRLGGDDRLIEREYWI
jgi:hypothetical protein